MGALGWLRSQWDRAAGYGCVALGTACLTVAVVEICRSAAVLSQLSYLASGALGGLLLGVVGVALLIAADLHDEWRKLDRIEVALTTDSSRTESPFWRTVPSAILRPLPVVLVVGGGAGMTAGFVRTSTTLSLDHAFQGLAFSVSGLLALGLAAAAILFRLRRIFGLRLAAAVSVWSGSRPTETTSAVSPVGDAGLVVVPGLHRYHRATCAMVAGLATTPLDATDWAATLQPCGICGATGERTAAGSAP